MKRRKEIKIFWMTIELEVDGDQLIDVDTVEGGQGCESAKGQKNALCGNRRPSNDCLPYEKSSKNRC